MYKVDIFSFICHSGLSGIFLKQPPAPPLLRGNKNEHEKYSPSPLPLPDRRQAVYPINGELRIECSPQIRGRFYFIPLSPCRKGLVKTGVLSQ
jgi:hypothetical protein